ncbi:MAG: class I SAM-dependent methyltransferase [Sandaracinaceae bacterium]|nr:class I SAM-dependent methyltransferase [Sandaracinaceae bacterium]
MTDLFHDKAADWDERPIPQQISEGVTRALLEAVRFEPGMTVMDFGAGTGLLASKIAPRVERLLAVDISEAMLEQLAKKPELAGKVDIHCRDILETPLEETVDLVVSAMAMHHVEDTRALFAAFHAHLVPGGHLALADLDTEPGTFHPPGTEGVFHDGFDRDATRGLLEEAGFTDVAFVTACEVDREERRYPIFLVTATRA